MPEYFDRYINKCDDVELLNAIQTSLDELDQLPLQQWEAIGNKTYAPGKMDAEGYIATLSRYRKDIHVQGACFCPWWEAATTFFWRRWLCISRCCQQPQPAKPGSGTESCSYLLSWIVQVIHAGHAAERRQSFKMYSVASIGFCMPGHQRWHLDIIKENTCRWRVAPPFVVSSWPGLFGRQAGYDWGYLVVAADYRHLAGFAVPGYWDAAAGCRRPADYAAGYPSLLIALLVALPFCCCPRLLFWLLTLLGCDLCCCCCFFFFSVFPAYAGLSVLPAPPISGSASLGLLLVTSTGSSSSGITPPCWFSDFIFFYPFNRQLVIVCYCGQRIPHQVFWRYLLIRKALPFATCVIRRNYQGNAEAHLSKYPVHNSGSISGRPHWPLSFVWLMDKFW